MGLPIPDPPIETGNDCPHCTPARWAIGETPKVISCMFWEINDCGVSPHHPPNGVIFRLQQDPAIPCDYFMMGDVWRPYFSARQPGDPSSVLRLFDHHGFCFFTRTSAICPPEYKIFANAQANCMLMFAGAGGFGTIFWGHDIEALVNMFGFDAGPGLFYELFKAVGLYNVHKFCDLDQRTNIRLKVFRFFNP